MDSVSLLKLVCKGPRPEPLHAQITAALQRQAWAAAPPGLMQQLHPLQASDDSAAEPPGRVAAGGQRQPGSSGGDDAPFLPDRAIVAGLVAIGFPLLHAVNAVTATRNAGNEGSVRVSVQAQGTAGCLPVVTFAIPTCLCRRARGG